MSRKKSSLVYKIIPGSFSERLNILRGEMTLEEYAKKIGVLPATLHTYLIGKKDRKPTIPPADFIAKVHKSTNVDAKWLLTGEGPMYRADRGGDIPTTDPWQDPKLYDIIHILKADPKAKEVIYEFLVGAKHFDRVANILRKFMVGKIKDYEEDKSEGDPIIRDINRIMKDNPGAKHTIYNLLETDVNFDRSLKIVKRYLDEKLATKASTPLDGMMNER